MSTKQIKPDEGTVNFPSFPAYPLNGGKLDDTTPPLVGDWVIQPKIDDWHAVIHVPSRTIWNQYGKLMSIANEFEDALDRLAFTPFQYLDCGMMERRNDMMRGSIIVFDVIVIHELIRVSHADRRAVLEKHLQTLPMASALLKAGNVHDATFLINEFDGRTKPLDIYIALQCENKVIGRKFYEGIVAKRNDAAYPIQLRGPKQATANQIKYRFDQ